TATPAIILLSLAVFYGLDRYSPADLLKLVPAHRFNLFAAFSKQSPPALLEKIEKAADRSLLDATGILIDLSQHSDYEVKIAAAKALARPFHASIPASENALTKLLDDSDFLVRGFAARSLAKIGTSTAISAIKRRAQRENDAAVRKLLQKLSV
ncbi:MAG: hypothetical protein DCC75_13790, partial [Proteobacteria bacterium]